MSYRILVSCLWLFYISRANSFQIPKISSHQSNHLKLVRKSFADPRWALERRQLSTHLTIKPLKSSTGVEVPLEPTTEPPYAMNQAQIVYFVMSSVFITCLLIADIVGVKIFEIMLPFPIFGFKRIEHTCGMLTFPLTFLLSDTINEYYGPQATKRTVYIGLWMSILVFGVVNVAQALPYLDKPFNVSPQAFNSIFSSAKLLYVASLVAYLVGQLSDIWLFGIIKRWTKGRYLWLRAGVSTVVSQLLDSFMVSYFAFRLGKQLTNQVPATMQEILNISVTGYGLKFLAAAAVTPLMYFLRYLLQGRYKLKPLPATYGMKQT